MLSPHNTCFKTLNKKINTQLKELVNFQKIHLYTYKASGQVKIDVLRKLGQNILDGVGMPTEWKSSVIIPLYKNKEDVRD